jgi:hypothetical protein
MARQEYIRELQQRAQEILQELRINDSKHIDELEGIWKILWSNIMDISNAKSPQGEQFKKVPTLGTPKGNMDWSRYIENMLREIGGKGKSLDVTEAIFKANPDMLEDRISHAVRHHLSKLLKNGKIGANKSKIRSEGYEFFIK